MERMKLCINGEINTCSWFLNVQHELLSVLWFCRVRTWKSTLYFSCKVAGSWAPLVSGSNIPWIFSFSYLARSPRNNPPPQLYHHLSPLGIYINLCGPQKACFLMDTARSSIGNRIHTRTTSTIMDVLGWKNGINEING